MTTHEHNPHEYKKTLEAASNRPEEKKQETKDSSLNKVILGMLIALALLAAFIIIKENLAVPPVYKYSNGDSEFEVRRITPTESQIEFYYGNKPEPFIMTIRYGPMDIEDIKIEDKEIKKRIADDETVYLTFDPKEELKGEAALAGLEVGKFIGNKYFFNIPVKSGLTSDYANNTVITCANATAKSTVIWIKKGKKTAIKTEGDCITIEGPTEIDMVKAADRLALYLVGIMP